MRKEIWYWLPGGIFVTCFFLIFWENTISADAYGRLQLAVLHLRQDHYFSIGPWPIGHLNFLSLLWKIVPHEDFARAVTAAASLLVIFPLLGIYRRVLADHALTSASGLLIAASVYAHALFASTMSEGPYFFTLFAHWYFFGRYLEERSLKHLADSAVFLMLASSLRFEAWGIAAFSSVFLAVHLFRTKSSRGKIGKALAIQAIAFAFIAPWAYFCYREAGDPLAGVNMSGLEVTYFFRYELEDLANLQINMRVFCVMLLQLSGGLILFAPLFPLFFRLEAATKFYFASAAFLFIMLVGKIGLGDVWPQPRYYFPLAWLLLPFGLKTFALVSCHKWIKWGGFALALAAIAFYQVNIVAEEPRKKPAEFPRVVEMMKSIPPETLRDRQDLILVDRVTENYNGLYVALAFHLGQYPDIFQHWYRHQGEAEAKEILSKRPLYYLHDFTSLKPFCAQPGLNSKFETSITCQSLGIRLEEMGREGNYTLLKIISVGHSGDP